MKGMLKLIPLEPKWLYELQHTVLRPYYIFFLYNCPEILLFIVFRASQHQNTQFLNYFQLKLPWSKDYRNN